MKPNTDIVSPYIGLDMDRSLDVYPKGAYTYALNGVLYSTDTSSPYIYSEPGSKLCWDKPADYTIVGHVNTESDTIILFIRTTSTSIIGEYDPDRCTFTEILSDPCLNFDPDYPVKAVFRLARGCDRMIYFTDNLNPVRVINLSNTRQYYEDDQLVCSRLSLSRGALWPDIRVENVIDGGGQIKVGVYQFALKYVDEDGNESGLTGLSEQVSIVDEPYSTDVYKIDGGYNYVEDLSETGAVPRANKSIQVKISNLDPNYTKFKLAILLYGAGSGVVSEAYLTEPIIIGSSEAIVTIRVLPDINYTTLDPQSIQVDPFVIDRAKYLTQVDSRLLVANTRYKNYDWDKVQQAALNIKITPYLKAIPKSDVLTGPRGPFYYRYKGFLRDEVYAFGVYGVLKNGNTTPVFHIPGRNAVDKDLTPITIVSDDTVNPALNEVRLANVRHLGKNELDIGTTVPRWKITNTSDLPGEMAYWEAPVKYPTISDCLGKVIYPINNIRHHRFPSVRTHPIEDKDNYYVMGVKVDLTDFINALPSEISEDVVEWRIARGYRDKINRTIDDKVLMSPLGEGSGSFHQFQLLFESDGKTLMHLQSAKAYLKRASLIASHIYVESEVDFSYVDSTSSHQGFTITHAIHTSTVSPSLGPLFRYGNYTINRYFYIDRITDYDGLELDETTSIVALPDFVDTTSGKVVNPSLSAHALYAELKYPFKYYPTLNSSDYRPVPVYASVKTGNDLVHTILDAIEYVPLNYVEEDDAYFGGDIFISPLVVRDSTLKPDPYSILYNITAVESEINAVLRHSNKVNDPIHGTYYDGDPTSLDDVIKYQRGPRDDNNELVYCFAEFFGYNDDYSTFIPIRKELPLPATYDYCNKCEIEYKFNYWVSEKSFNDELSDSYRVFKVNNMGSVPGDVGQITAVEEWNGRLYILTTRNILVQPVSPQTLSTNVDLVYLGTGQILSIPPVKLFQTPYAASGCEDWRSIVKTERGFYYASLTTGSIYAIQASSPSEISVNGISKWAKENLTFKLSHYLYEQTGHIIFKPSLLKMLSGYNPLTKSVVFTKKDYLPIVKIIGTINSEIEPLEVGYYLNTDDDTIYFYNGNNLQKVDMTSNRLFSNESFTLSLFTINGTWQSFHSYLPDYIMNNSKYMITAVNGQRGLWIHNDKVNRCRFYGINRPFIVELVSASIPILQKNFTGIRLLCDIKKYKLNSDNIHLVDTSDEFFSHIIAYTRNSSTGKLPIEVTNSIFNNSNNSKIYAMKIENKWRLNYLPDKYTNPDEPMFTSEWAYIAPEYPIDKVVNPLAISDTPMLTTPRLKGEYLVARLIKDKIPPYYLMGINVAEFDANVYNI